jgi:hypothetical protein
MKCPKCGSTASVAYEPTVWEKRRDMILQFLFLFGSPQIVGEIPQNKCRNCGKVFTYGEDSNQDTTQFPFPLTPFAEA